MVEDIPNRDVNEQQGPDQTFLEEVLAAAEREQKRKIKLKWFKLVRMQVQHGRLTSACSSGACDGRQADRHGRERGSRGQGRRTQGAHALQRSPILSQLRPTDILTAGLVRSHVVRQVAQAPEPGGGAYLDHLQWWRRRSRA